MNAAVTFLAKKLSIYYLFPFDVSEDAKTASGVSRISFWGINLTHIIYLPGWELVHLLSCPFAVQCMAILGI